MADCPCATKVHRDDTRIILNSTIEPILYTINIQITIHPYLLIQLYCNLCIMAQNL